MVSPRLTYRRYVKTVSGVPSVCQRRSGAGMTGLRAQQRERTRSVLLEVSRRLFASRGYAAVGLADLVSEAGVTKGALYHHFEGGKTDLFRAVVEQVHEEIGT